VSGGRERGEGDEWGERRGGVEGEGRSGKKKEVGEWREKDRRKGRMVIKGG